MKLNVHEFTDTVCLFRDPCTQCPDGAVCSQVDCIEDETCIEGFPIYGMFEQQGMYPKSDGIVGIAPVPLGTKGTDSFITTLFKQGKINNPIVSFYYSKYPAEVSSSILIGDLDGSVVEGGEEAIEWFSTLDDGDWQVEITQGFFGD